MAHTLLFVYALRQDAQDLCSRVLTLACPGFLTVADIKRSIGATRGRLDRAKEEWFTANPRGVYSVGLLGAEMEIPAERIDFASRPLGTDLRSVFIAFESV